MTNISSSLASRLESAIGASHVVADPAVCSQYAVDEIIPSVVAKPASAGQVAEIVRFAALEKLALIPCGHRTKLAIGMPPSRYDIALDMSGLHQIAHYDPGDLTVSVDAGLPLANVNAALFEHHQFLPLLVPWYSRSTIGGVISSGIDSPLRQAYGTARDFLIGAEFVDGTGRPCKSGGRVVKNVTGYDLHKLLIGSLGTLAVITRLNFRTFPAPPASRGFVASFPAGAGALTLRHKIAESPLAPLTHDILSPGLAQIFASRTPGTPEVAVFSSENHTSTQTFLPPIGDFFRTNEWQLCAAFGGAPEVLGRYGRDLTRLAEESKATSISILDDSARPSVWGRLRETVSMLLETSPAAAIFKLSALPSQHAALFTNLSEIADRSALPHALVARAAGVIYFALLPPSNEHESLNTAPLQSLAEAASAVFTLCAEENASATLLWCPTQLKRQINIWSPDFVAPASSRDLSSSGSAAARRGVSLIRRLKSAFDPQNIFAPGRLLSP
ncbi:MAG TPA: FAD-binding oxidoreductase [Candidatus Acidoferrum sp.]